MNENSINCEAGTMRSLAAATAPRRSAKVDLRPNGSITRGDDVGMADDIAESRIQIASTPIGSKCCITRQQNWPGLVKSSRGVNRILRFPLAANPSCFRLARSDLLATSANSIQKTTDFPPNNTYRARWRRRPASIAERIA